MRLNVTLLHNQSEMSFRPLDAETIGSSSFFHAHTFPVTADNMNLACNIVFELANVDSAEMLSESLRSYGPLVTHYRKRMNRSMSVGDVLVIESPDGEVRGVFACDILGWKGLEFIPEHDRTAGNYSIESASFEAYRIGRGPSRTN